jgi:hypothetical protein
MPVLACFACLAGVTSAAGQAAEVLYEKRAPGVLDRSVLVDRRDFSVELAESLAWDFLAAYRGLMLSKLTIFVDREAEVRFSGGKRVSHPSYYDAARYHDDPDWRPTVAEMLHIGESAILRVALPDGAIRSKVLLGSNPLEIRLPGIEAEILWVYVGEYGPKPSVIGIRVYVRLAGELSQDRAQRIAEKVWSRIPYRDVKVTVRTDEWFIESGGYPWVNPFLPPAPLPPYEEFAKSERYFCSNWIDKGCMHFAGILHPVELNKQPPLQKKEGAAPRQ